MFMVPMLSTQAGGIMIQETIHGYKMLGYGYQEILIVLVLQMVTVWELVWILDFKQILLVLLWGVVLGGVKKN